MLHAFIFVFLGSAIAAPQLQGISVLAPSVTVKNGTIIGSSSSGVDTFKGIPFAQPPLGALRLKPPQSITKPYGTITATSTPTACPQQYFDVNSTSLPEDVIALLLDTPYAQTATVSGEDCLTINVQRPSTATSSSKLPVVFWIYGGGFEFGSTQSYDATSLIIKSISLSKPIIYVAVNYRVSGFGFLAGKQLQKEGSTNLGLRDQRLGLQWVQDNIAAFGGDPAKVTIWGESAGSISVFDHTIINNGDNTYKGAPLFRAAIMDSGSVVPAQTVSSAKAQAVFDGVVAAAGCSSASNPLSCLRSLPYTSFLNAVNSQPGIFDYSSVNLAYLPRPDPSSSFFSQSAELAVAAGKYARVPTIIGDQEDEGTLFSLSQSNISTTDQLVTYLASFFPATPRNLVAQLVATYPDDPSAGSPFRTSLLYNLYPQFKRLAAILGDTTFTLARRSYLNSITAKGVPAWSYLASYLYGTPVLGTFHASDILEVYQGLPYPVPRDSIQAYYIAFINGLDPNSLGTASPLVAWPRWNSSQPTLVNFQAVQNVLLADDFRNVSYAFLASHGSSFRV